MKFFVSHHMGMVATELKATTLEEAKREVDENIEYSCQPVYILTTETKGVIAQRPWWPGFPTVEDDSYINENDPICFGNFGYYGDWIEKKRS